jgi:hypothetical protein
MATTENSTSNARVGDGGVTAFAGRGRRCGILFSRNFPEVGTVPYHDDLDLCKAESVSTVAARYDLELGRFRR